MRCEIPCLSKIGTGFLLLCLLLILTAGCRDQQVNHASPSPSPEAGLSESPEVLEFIFRERQLFGESPSWDLAIDDLNGDDYLDLVVATLGSADPKV